MPSRHSYILLLATINALHNLCTATTYSKIINITQFAFIPAVVSPGEYSTDILCSYEGHFSILNLLKNDREFFRYKPTATPSTKTFPLAGVGAIDLISCGPTECRLRLSHLTKDASGWYRCDIEYDKPPFEFKTSDARLTVYRHDRRKPLVEGLAVTYGEGDEIRAYCRTENQAQVFWYVNGKEVVNRQNEHIFTMISQRQQYQNDHMAIQCGEIVDGKLLLSSENQIDWIDKSLTSPKPDDKSCDPVAKHQKNGVENSSLIKNNANTFINNNRYVCIILLLLACISYCIGKY